jgi:hypothetical protein
MLFGDEKHCKNLQKKNLVIFFFFFYILERVDGNRNMIMFLIVNSDQLLTISLRRCEPPCKKIRKNVKNKNRKLCTFL